MAIQPWTGDDKRTSHVSVKTNIDIPFCLFVSLELRREVVPSPSIFIVACASSVNLEIWGVFDAILDVFLAPLV